MAHATPSATGLTVGRGEHERHVRIFNDDQIARRHFRISRESTGEYLVSDLGSTSGTLLNGQQVFRQEVLADGDQVTGGFTTLTFRTRPARGLDALALQLAQTPNSDAAWAVYADALLDRGDPLGARIAARDTSLEPRDPLFRASRAGLVELEWGHGFIRRARLRAGSAACLLTGLQVHPLAMFLVELEVGQLTADTLRVARLPALRSLVFGATFSPEIASRNLAMLNALEITGSPHLSNRGAPFRRQAWLERQGAAPISLEAGRGHTEGPIFIAWDEERGGWQARRSFEAAGHLAINGIGAHAFSGAMLWSGDVVSCADRSVVFCASADESAGR